MNPKVVMTILSFLGSKEGRALINIVKNGDNDVLTNVLKGFGLSNPQQSDVEGLKGLVGAFGSDDKSIKDKMQSIKDLYVDPKELLLKGIVTAGSEAIRAGGDIAANNANRLAQAILRGRRVHTDRQNERFGFNPFDQANEEWAQNRIRKGETTKRVTDAVSNTIDKVLGMYDQGSIAYKGLASGQYMSGTPGQFYEYLNGMQRRGQQITGGTK